MLVDYNGIKMLCGELIKYCVSMTDKTGIIGPNLMNASDLPEDIYTDWIRIQEWVIYYLMMLINAECLTTIYN